ncbi:hypothetical protein ACJX0J_009719, partial [Zea mays]
FDWFMHPLRKKGSSCPNFIKCHYVQHCLSNWDLLLSEILDSVSLPPCVFRDMFLLAFFFLHQKLYSQCFFYFVAYMIFSVAWAGQRCFSLLLVYVVYIWNISEIKLFHNNGKKKIHTGHCA